MPFKEKIAEIDQLLQKIERYGKLPQEVLQKINYKFRLDWNYYSNRMEGNTLTKEETKNVMIGNIDVHNKPLKDVMEIKGHDDAIQAILKMGKGELNISEARIKGLHKAIMYEGDEVGREKIGQWKLQPNHIINYRSEKFDFDEPSEVPEKMHNLINWINAEKERIQSTQRNALHPVELAFEFHLRYLTIHPFFDGNGRTARILTNLVLISYGYPPVYVKDADKDAYYRYLAEVQAYGADRYLFFDIMAGYLLRSVNLVLDAIVGKEIDEPDDLDKKIQMLEVELNAINPDDEVKARYSKDVFLKCYETWIAKFIDLTVPVIQKFNKLFTDVNHQISLQQGGIYVSFNNEAAYIITENLKEEVQKNLGRISQIPPEIRIQASYGALIKGGLKTFRCTYGIIIKFEDLKYEVFVDDIDETNGSSVSKKQYTRLLHQPLTEKEMNDAAQMLGNAIFRHIDFYTRKNGLRQ